MLSKSSFLTTNLTIGAFPNYHHIRKKNQSHSYNKTLCISHGSGGISKTEFHLCDFFLERGFEVQIFDHFSTLGIKRLNWGYEPGFIDHFNASLGDLIDTLSPGSIASKYHLGLSLGGYIGLNHLDKFEKVFCCYPGMLPLVKNSFESHSSRAFVFEGSKDRWTRVPQELRRLIPEENYFEIEGSYHSFMSPTKNKTCPVYRYQFRKLLVPRAELYQIYLNHDSFLRHSQAERIFSINRSSPSAAKFVLDTVLGEIRNGSKSNCPTKTHYDGRLVETQRF